MAASQMQSSSEQCSLSSHQTALCLVPPAHLCAAIDQLRAHHDKAFGKWPPHINLLYPFVAVEDLPKAVELIGAKLTEFNLQSGGDVPRLLLDEPGSFTHRHNRTVFITDSNAQAENSHLQQLRHAIMEPFRSSGSAFYPHLTLGQTQGLDVSSRDYLLGKAALLPNVSWPVKELVVLVRERTTKGEGQSSVMRVWGSINVAESSVSQTPQPMDFRRKLQLEEDLSDSEDQAQREIDPDDMSAGHVPQIQGTPTGASTSHSSQSGTTYRFHEAEDRWNPHRSSSTPSMGEESPPSTLAISSYNVLVGYVYPPERERYSILVRTILSEAALADVLVLQEVADAFLSYLLQDHSVRRHYPFTTHAPSDQPDIGPLASMRNIVVLSKRGFRWEWIPFKRRHKGAVVVAIDDVGKQKGSTFLPVVLAAVHLTCGLTDGSVAAKKSQLQTVVGHLTRNYPGKPWLVAGDFNLTTSSLTIEQALKTKSISQQAVATLSGIESMLSDAILLDTWHVARVEVGSSLSASRSGQGTDDTCEGEEGATFNPLENPLAAETISGGLSDRPQRYDKIFVREEGLLRVIDFGQFGFIEERNENQDVLEPLHGSDHWGVRASFRIQGEELPAHDEATRRQLATSLKLRKAPLAVSSISDLKVLLADHGMFPAEDESLRRREALGLLRNILQHDPVRNTSSSESSRSNVSVMVVPVGSYALGVWNGSSDIDCLCVGNISTKTFFMLAVQKLRKASDRGVRIVRKVVAASGKMLELEVKEFRVELHYCSATKIAESWPDVLQLPPSDPCFDLPIQSLTKLQPLRDIDYLQRTIADLASFRLAHRLIKLWAVKRGIYSSRFGYLGGIHITLLLSRICKLLYREASHITAADIVMTFFGHYAHFDWDSSMVYDPFFHDQEPRYRRMAREPVVILSLHRPLINVAHTASVPSRMTLQSEFKRANRILSAATTPSWPALIGGDEGEKAGSEVSPASQFLASFTSFIKLDVHYWGMSAGKGAALLGWLESRCALLLVDLGRKLPSLHARIWPTRFSQIQTDKSANAGDDAEEEHQRNYQGCYLIGLAKATDNTAATDSKSAQSALYTAMNKFREQIRGDEKHFDPTKMWIDVELVSGARIRGLVPDERIWAQIEFVDGEEDDSEDDAEVEEDELHQELGQLPEGLLDANVAPFTLSNRQKSRHSGATAGQPRAKLRPASDVLHRLRWDPELDSADYVIGYEDRFLGVREMALAKWKTEQTDLEFIPQHRIVYFRRKGDGVKVWDRERRIDEMFGSGIGAGPAGSQ